MNAKNRVYDSFISISFREYCVFILCLIISIALLFQRESPQVNQIRAGLVDVFARMFSTSSQDQSRNSSDVEVKALRRRTTELLLENSRLRQAGLENYRFREMLNMKNESDLRLVAAEIIAFQKGEFAQTIVIDAGARDGIKKNMPIVSPQGLCGKVFRVGEESSTAHLLVDHNFRVACKIERTRADGILSYADGKLCELKQTPKYADVRVGDVVVTSGYTKFFPKNLRVGVVQEVHNEPTSLFKVIKVEPFVNFTRLEEVFVVTSVSESSLDEVQ